MSTRHCPYKGDGLFIDENLSPAYCQIFNLIYGFEAKTTREIPNAKNDIDIFNALREHDPIPILFGADIGMWSKADEITVLKSARIPMVIATNKFVNTRFEDQVWRVIKYWPEVMANFARSRNQILRVDFFKEDISLFAY